MMIPTHLPCVPVAFRHLLLSVRIRVHTRCHCQDLASSEPGWSSASSALQHGLWTSGHRASRWLGWRKRPTPSLPHINARLREETPV